eukprot:EG_transcript_25450
MAPAACCPGVGTLTLLALVVILGLAGNRLQHRWATAPLPKVAPLQWHWPRGTGLPQPETVLRQLHPNEPLRGGPVFAASQAIPKPDPHGDYLNGAFAASCGAIFRTLFPATEPSAEVERALASAREEALFLLQEQEFDEEQGREVYVNWPDDVWPLMQSMRSQGLSYIITQKQTMRALQRVRDVRLVTLAREKPVNADLINEVKKQPTLLYALLFLSRYVASDLARLRIATHNETVEPRELASGAFEAAIQ